MNQARQVVTLHHRNGTEHGRITFTPISISFESGEVCFRVGQNSGESGEAEALNFIECLHEQLNAAGIQHEAHTRRYGDSRNRIDAILINQTAVEPVRT